MSNIQQKSLFKSYSEMCSLGQFEERFKYLKLNGQVGMDTFGFDRYMNQGLYKSKEWRQLRSYIITRDNGCDLACQDRPIGGRIYIHHINPISQEDIKIGTDRLFDPENLVCVSQDVHNAIHYGDVSLIKKNDIIERFPNDTTPWKR